VHVLFFSHKEDCTDLLFGFEISPLVSYAGEVSVKKDLMLTCTVVILCITLLSVDFSFDG